MTKTRIALTVALLAAGFISTATQAAPVKPAAKVPACPFCKMPLSVKATKETPVAILVKGKKYYTCTPCKPKVAAMKSVTKVKPMAKM